MSGHRGPAWFVFWLVLVGTTSWITPGPAAVLGQYQNPQFAVPEWAQSIRPLRVVFDARIGVDANYDCLTAGQDVKLGQPDDYEDPDLKRCASAYGRPIPGAIVGLEDNCWLTCMASEVVSSAGADFLRAQVAAVRDEFQQKLQILWPQDTVRLIPATTDPSTGKTVSACPMLNSNLIDELRGQSSELDTATQGDIYIFVTARPTVQSANAETSTCMRDGFGRPIIAHININAALLQMLVDDAAGGGSRGVPMLRNVLRHEMLHALALTWTSLSQFRGPDRRLLVHVMDVADVRGISGARFLVTPWAQYALTLHYNVTIGLRVPGVEISGDGSTSRTSMLQELAPALNAVHLANQVASTDVAAAKYDEYSVFSALSLAILGDTGWYIPRMELAEPLCWGRGQSEDFLIEAPTIDSSASAVYNCDPVQANLRCAFDRRFKGYCVGVDRSSPDSAVSLSAAQSDASTSNAVWPLAWLGSCMTGAADEAFSAGTAALQVGKSGFKETFSPESRCHLLSGPAGNVPACLDSTCTADGVDITIGSSITHCPYGSSVDVIIAGGQYTITCPLENELCPVPDPPPPVCPNYCSNLGTCVANAGTLTCACDEHWGGPDCTKPMCPRADEQSTDQCSGHGECTDDQQCECKSGYTGVDCGMPMPECNENCALRGEGFSCFSDRCEKQCSIGGRSCVDASLVSPKVPECKDYLERMDSLCIPDGDLDQVVSDLRKELRKETARLGSLPDKTIQNPNQCSKTVNALVCFSIFRECNQPLNLELPLCKKLCDLYEFDCNPSVLNCEDDQTWATAKSSDECSGYVGPKQYLTTQRLLLYLLFAVATIILIIALAWLLRIWFRYHNWATWCFGGTIADPADIPSQNDVPAPSRGSSPASRGGPRSRLVARRNAWMSWPWTWVWGPSWTGTRRRRLIGRMRQGRSTPESDSRTVRVVSLVDVDGSVRNPRLLDSPASYLTLRTPERSALTTSRAPQSFANAPAAWEPELQELDDRGPGLPGGGSTPEATTPTTQGLTGVTMGRGGWVTDGETATLDGASTRISGPLKSAFAGDDASSSSATAPWMRAAWANQVPGSAKSGAADSSTGNSPALGDSSRVNSRLLPPADAEPGLPLPTTINHNHAFQATTHLDDLPSSPDGSSGPLPRQAPHDFFLMHKKWRDSRRGPQERQHGSSHSPNAERHDALQPLHSAGEASGISRRTSAPLLAPDDSFYSVYHDPSSEFSDPSPRHAVPSSTASASGRPRSQDIHHSVYNADSARGDAVAAALNRPASVTDVSMDMSRGDPSAFMTCTSMEQLPEGILPMMRSPPRSALRPPSAAAMEHGHSISPALLASGGGGSARRDSTARSDAVAASPQKSADHARLATAAQDAATLHDILGTASTAFSHDPFTEDSDPNCRVHERHVSARAASSSMHDSGSMLGTGHLASPAAAEDALLHQRALRVAGSASSSGAHQHPTQRPTLLDDPFLGVDASASTAREPDSAAAQIDGAPIHAYESLTTLLDGDSMHAGEAHPPAFVAPYESLTSALDGEEDAMAAVEEEEPVYDGPYESLTNLLDGQDGHAAEREDLAPRFQRPYETLTSLLGEGDAAGEGADLEGDAGLGDSVHSDPFLPGSMEMMTPMAEELFPASSGVGTDEGVEDSQLFGHSGTSVERSALSDPFLDADMSSA